MRILFFFLIGFAGLAGLFCKESGDEHAHHQHETPNEDFNPAERFPAAREIAAPIPGQLPFFKGADWQPFWSKDETEIKELARTVGAFRLLDQENKTFGREDLRGRMYVANFFFTRCPGICPVTMPNLKKVQARYQADQGLLLISYTITPDTDTPAVLAEYARKMEIRSGRWRLLTGPKEAIYNLARDSYEADEDTGEARSDGDFIHSEHGYLVDRQHRIRGIYNLKSPPNVEMLIQDIALLKKIGS